MGGAGYLRAALVALVGVVVGVVVGGPLTGWVVELTGRTPEGLEALLPVLLGAAAGAFVGGAVAVWIAFRHDSRRARRTAALTVLIGGPLLFFPGWELLAPADADFLSPPLVLAVALVVAALIGRWLARRS